MRISCVAVSIAMILMEGGNENDMRILEQESPASRERKKSRSSPSKSPDRKKGGKKPDGQAKKALTADPPSPSSVPLPSDPPPARKTEVDAAAKEAAEKSAKEKQHEEFLKKQEVCQGHVIMTSCYGRSQLGPV